MIIRAAIFDGAGQPFRVAELPLPAQLEKGVVLVEIALATICGSDLHTCAGRRKQATPCVLGHEGVGRVIAVGETREAWLNKRVTWSSADSCGQCKACIEWDLPQKCERVFKYGHVRVDKESVLHGTYASHMLVRGGTHLVEVPDRISDGVAASMNCSLATMANVTEHLPVPCRVAVVQGAGLLGLHGCALLRDAGVERVMLVDHDESRLAGARQFGGEPVKSHEIMSASVDLVIEVAGAPSVIGEGLRMLRPGGHYHIAGMVHPDSAISVTGEAIIRGCVVVRGFHNYAPRHLERAVEFLSKSLLPWENLVSHPLPLERIEDAIALAESRQWARVAISPLLSK